jgi:hypothetical protein
MADLDRARAHVEIARVAMNAAIKYVGDGHADIVRDINNADGRLEHALKTFDALDESTKQ